jgi:hypothetical protein
MKTINLTPCLYPSAARKYAILSPDRYCTAHLAHWIKTKGKSLDSYRQWLNFRLNTDFETVQLDDGSTDWLDQFSPENEITEQTIEFLDFAINF